MSPFAYWNVWWKKGQWKQLSKMCNWKTPVKTKKVSAQKSQLGVLRRMGIENQKQ